MKFVTIEPSKLCWSLVEAESTEELYVKLGLNPKQLDHGTIAMPHQTPKGIGIGIVVDGFGLFRPKEKQRYFSIGHKLFGGNAVLYGFNEGGESADMEEMPLVLFMSLKGVEEAIERGQITRPYSEINGERYWEWPQPSPFGKLAS